MSKVIRNCYLINLGDAFRNSNKNSHYLGSKIFITKLVFLLRRVSSVKTRTLENPDPEKALKTIRKSFSENLTTIFGEWEVGYKGRASSYLGLGDRLIILKPDGTLLVHKEEKRKPVNWQPPKSKHSVKIKDDRLVVKSVRDNPKESITIIFEEIHQVSSLHVKDPEQLELRGTEDDMGKRIMKSPEIIEKGLEPIKREKNMDFGYIDIYGKDQNNNHVIIELKRRRVGPEAVSQLKRYVDEFKESINQEKVRGILVSPSVTGSARNLLEKEELEHVALKAKPLRDYDINEKTLDEF